MATSQDIQTLIDAQVALVLTLTNQLNDLNAEKPNYTTAGRTIQWQSLYDSLDARKNNAIKAAKDLQELQNIVAPYIIISHGGRC